MTGKQFTGADSAGTLEKVGVINNLGHSLWEQIVLFINDTNRKNDLILIMTPEKQGKTLELSKHWSVDSTPARNEVIMKRTYPVKSVKCDKICSNY